MIDDDPIFLGRRSCNCVYSSILPLLVRALRCVALIVRSRGSCSRIVLRKSNSAEGNSEQKFEGCFARFKSKVQWSESKIGRSINRCALFHSIPFSLCTDPPERSDDELFAERWLSVCARARLRHMFRVSLINNLWLDDNNEGLLTDGKDSTSFVFCFGSCVIRWQRRSKAAQDVEYPAYGITGPGPSSGKSSLKSSPSTSNPPAGGWGTSPGKVAAAAAANSGDKKLAHSAHMFHFQHQKQQVIAMERYLQCIHIIELIIGSFIDDN